MTPENLKPKFGNVQMPPLSPDKILRNLDHGYTMTHQEQAEAAQYIRQLQQAVLAEREACAKLCEEWSASFDDGVFFAATIRARGNHGQD